MDRERIRRAAEAISAYDFGRSTAALFEMDRLINASHGDDGARAGIESELAGLLGSGSSLAARQEVCRRLWRIGTDASLPALEPLLRDSDPRIVAAACFAIGRRPSAQADEMLRQALRQAPEACRPALERLLADRG